MDWDEELKRQAAISSLLAPPEDSQAPLDTKVDEQVTAPEVIQPDKSDWHKLADQIFDTESKQYVGEDKPSPIPYDTQVAESVVPYGEGEKPSTPVSDYAPKDTGKGAAPEDYPTVAQDQGAGETSGQQAPDALNQVERATLVKFPDGTPATMQRNRGVSLDPTQGNLGDEELARQILAETPPSPEVRRAAQVGETPKAEPAVDPIVARSIAKNVAAQSAPASAATPAPAQADQTPVVQPQTTDDWGKLADSIFPSADKTKASEVAASTEPMMNAPNGQAPAALIIHHTSGNNSAESVVNDWRTNRPGVGAQMIMDRDGTIHYTQKEFGYGGTGNFLHSVIPGVSNQTAVGIEVIAKDDADMTRAQLESLKRLAGPKGPYANVPVYGHSQVSPGDRDNEGVRGVAAINEARAAGPTTSTGEPGTTPIETLVKLDQSGLNVTHFGYKDDSNLDPDSAAGHGKYVDQMIPGYDVALNEAAAAKLGVKPGETFTFAGREFRYGDKVPERYKDARFDIYDQDGTALTGAMPVGRQVAAAAAAPDDWTKLADNWVKASPEEQAAGEKQNRDTLDNLNRSTQNPGDFWKKISQHIDGVPDDQRQQYADNWKKEVVKNAQDFYGEKDPEKAFARATSDPGFEAYVSNVGRGLAGAVGQADIGIGLMGKNIDNNRVDGFAKLVHPESTGEGRAGFIKTLTDIQDVHHRHDVFNEIYGNLSQNTKDAIGDPASILDSIDHLADPKYQADLNKAIATKKAWVDQQLGGDPSLRGTSAGWWTTGTGENIFNTVAAIVPGGVGAVVRTSTLGSQMYSSNMDRIAKEHPDWSSAQVSDEASKSAFLQLAPQEAVMALTHGITAPLLKWAGAAAERPIVRFGIGGGVQVGAAAVGGAAGQVGENVAENKPLLENVPQAAGSAVVQSLPFAVHGGLHGVAEGPPVKPEPAPPPPEPPPPRPTQTSGLENAPEPMPEVTLRPGQQVRTSEILGREPGEPRGVIRGDILGPEETGTPPMGERWYDPGPITTRPIERTAFSPQELQQTVAKLSDAGMSPDQIHQVISQLRPGLEQNLQSVHLGTEGDLEAARTQQLQANTPGPVIARSEAKPPVDRAAARGSGSDLAEVIRQQKAAAGLGGAPAPQESNATPLGGAPGELPPRLGSADRMTGNAGVEEPWESRIANKYVKERMAAGELGTVEPGTGKTTEELLAHGLTMKPEEINQHMSDIMQGKGDPVEQTAAMRAEEARLSHRSHEASLIAEADPNNSAKQLAADNALKDLTDLYNGPMRKLKQNWHRQGVAFQDRVPIDLSTYNGIRAEFIKSTGKTEVPAQAEAGMRKSAAQVRAAGDNLKARMQKLGSEAEKNGANRKLPSIDKVAEDVMGVMKHDPCPV